MQGRCPPHDNRSHVRVAGTALRWTFAYPSANQGGNTVESSPVVAADGTIYVGSEKGVLYAVTPDGQAKWSVTTGGAIHATPAIGADGTAFVGSDDGGLYAVAAGGSTRWVFHAGAAVSSPALGADGTVYVVSQDGALHAIDPSDGTARWTYKGDGTSGDASPAIGADGTLYVAFRDTKMHAIGPGGSEKWAYDNRTAILTPASVGADGTVYFGGGALVAVGAAAVELWSSPTQGSLIAMPALAGDGTVYFTASDGPLRAVSAAGALRWAFPTSSQPEATIVDASGTIYFGSRDHHVYVVAPDGSQAAPSVALPGEVRSSPTIGADGTLYVASADGTLSAFGR
jgi:outer membrane protein assembly factor BamB